MAGLVPAIHVFAAVRKAWMAATSAAMTVEFAYTGGVPFSASTSPAR